MNGLYKGPWIKDKKKENWGTKLEGGGGGPPVRGAADRHRDPAWQRPLHHGPGQGGGGGGEGYLGQLKGEGGHKIEPKFCQPRAVPCPAS